MADRGAGPPPDPLDWLTRGDTVRREGIALLSEVRVEVTGTAADAGAGADVGPAEVVAGVEEREAGLADVAGSAWGSDGGSGEDMLSLVFVLCGEGSSLGCQHLAGGGMLRGGITP